MTAAPPPPGWYPDPSGARRQRYFDGSEWTEHYAARLSLEQRSELLEDVLFNSYPGARIESRSPTQAVLLLGGGVSGAAHVVFALLTIFTCGLFGIIWLIVAATSHERRAYIAVDPYGNVTFNGRQWTAVDSPAKGPEQAGSASGGPPAAAASDKSFLARHRADIVIISAVLLLAGGCVAFIAGSGTNNPQPKTPTATPTTTPDQKFKQDMDNEFDAKMNPGKNPVTDIWDYRTFTDAIIGTGHEICGYLGSHSYDETVQQFKLRLPLGYPTDSDGREFVNTAIDDLCPQYSSMTNSPPRTTTSAPSPPPGPLVYSQLISVSLPAGSTPTGGHPVSGIEMWHVPLDAADEVANLRSQLPIGKPYNGLAWCKGRQRKA